jgi:glucoamylase
MTRSRAAFSLVFCLLAAIALTGSAGAATPAVPPANPPKPNWLPADKQGFGTSRTLASKVWFTLQGGSLSEVYYPTLDTPSFRDLQFVVDGVSERDGAVARVAQFDPLSPTYRQTDTDKGRRWRLTKIYVTDPRRNSVLLDVRFQSLDGRRHRVSILADAAPSNQTDTAPAGCSRSGVLASDPQMAIALRGQPAIRIAGCSAQDGIVSTTASTPLTGRPGHQALTLALGFGGTPHQAVATARASLGAGWIRAAITYEIGWHRYLASLRKPPRSLATLSERREYVTSEMVLAASEDKTFRGAFVASPTMPWAWGTGLQTPSGPITWSGRATCTRSPPR